MQRMALWPRVLASFSFAGTARGSGRPALSTIRTEHGTQSSFLRGNSAERIDEEHDFDRFFAGIFTL